MKEFPGLEYTLVLLSQNTTPHGGCLQQKINILGKFEIFKINIQVYTYINVKPNVFKRKEFSGLLSQHTIPRGECLQQKENIYVTQIPILVDDLSRNLRFLSPWQKQTNIYILLKYLFTKRIHTTFIRLFDKSR